MATATMTATVEQGEAPAAGVRLVRLNGSLTQKGVADVGPFFTAAIRGQPAVPRPPTGPAAAPASPPSAGPSAAGQTAAAPTPAGADTVVVDLSGVDVIATTGITLLLVADRELKRSGGRMVLAGTRGLVKEVLLRCRLDKVLTLAPTAQDAIESARRAE